MACGIGRDAVARLGSSCLRESELKLIGTVLGVVKSVRPPSDASNPRLDLTALRGALLGRTGCSDEVCVIDAAIESAKGTRLEALLERIRAVAFKAQGPRELDALLDNFLITRMCLQVEANATMRITFGGVLTYDFMIPPPTTPLFSPAAVYQSWASSGWRQMHLVLNLDHRMGEGQHWTAICIEVAPAPSPAAAVDRGVTRDSATDDGDATPAAGDGSIEYFDSYGIAPPNGLIRGSRPWRGITTSDGRFLSRLDEWIGDVRRDFIAHGIPMRRRVNTMQHQESADAASCGVYATYFLYRRSTGVSFDEFNSRAIPMREITAQRDRLYLRTDGYTPTPILA